MRAGLLRPHVNTAGLRGPSAQEQVLKVCWPIAVLTAVFGVKLESAAGAVPEGLA